MNFNVYNMKIEKISDLTQQKLAQQHFPKYFIFPCEDEHLK